jgi:hypothetical protein
LGIADWGLPIGDWRLLIADLAIGDCQLAIADRILVRGGLAEPPGIR